MSQHQFIAPPSTTSFEPFSVSDDAQQVIRMIYQNYRGEVSERRVVPRRIRFGATEYHPKLQWLMDAFDLDRNEERAFALCDIKHFIQET